MWYDLGPIEDHYQDPDYDFYGEEYRRRLYDREDEEDYERYDD